MSDRRCDPSSARLAVVVVREAVRDALAVLVPVTCAGCGAPDRAVCPGCLGALTPAVHTVERAGVPVVAAYEYEGVIARVIGACKDAGRTDAAPVLGAALEAAIGTAIAALPAGAPVELCVIPSTRAARRDRGYEPVPAVLAAVGLRPARVLRALRPRGDQAALGIEARLANTAGAFVARSSLAGRRFLVVDDVLTTGATVAEAVRALRIAGGEVAGAAVIAQTRRLHQPAKAFSRPP